MKIVSKFKRALNHKNFSQLGIITCAGFAIVKIVLMCLNAIVFKVYSGNIIELVLDIINLIFYLAMTSIFIKGKDEFYYCYQGLLILIINDFIFPFISSLLSGVLLLSLIMPSLVMSLGVAYFITLCIDRKKQSKSTMITLKILGILTAIISIAFSVYEIVLISKSLVFIDSWYIVEIIIFIIGTILGSIFEPLLLALYPFILEKERM
ncbi:MAG: hypothetical protein SOV26_03910 [Candidatus Onthovivens sp.]|nr:hypothetical protein [Candidatus Onthovivens sp.]